MAQKVAGSTLGRSTVRQQPWASCLHTGASDTKQYNLVPVRGGDALRLGR